MLIPRCAFIHSLTQLLHQRRVAQTHVAVAQRIRIAVWTVARSAARLIGDADDLEAISGDAIDKVGIFDFNGLHRVRCGPEGVEGECEGDGGKLLGNVEHVVMAAVAAIASRDDSYHCPHLGIRKFLYSQ